MENTIVKKRSLIEKLLFPRTQGLRVAYHILFWTCFILLHYAYALPVIGRKSADATVTLANFSYFLKIIPEYYICVGIYNVLGKYVRGILLAFIVVIAALITNHVFSIFMFIGVDKLAGLENMTERFQMFSKMYLQPFDFRDIRSWLVFTNDLSEIQFFMVPATLKMAKYAANETIARQKLQSDALAMELKALKSQINPHFVFNVLNAAYAKILPISEDAAEHLQKIAEILRFSLYEMDDEFIGLEKELSYMNLYIELESIRSNRRCKVNVSKYGQIAETHRIPTLSLITLVENAFKHGVHASRKESYVNILIDVSSGSLEFTIANSKPENPVLRAKEGRSGGIGLVNLEKRLEIYYPGRYEFEKTETAAEFTVSVTFPLE
ncbi:hypothetical protein GCM10010967_32040 [Dyadobacter beijingensis]|uniref:Signal transduction histidine kinase internal region domain-containing protein n=1 Tax=Dyadobacter beijingensis TaxID=365489 RepID=A0ABQ2I0D0_9BACT|nr:histidine kinase [Dyadobacter beijingensis]GGM96085.1 hypothetical protein GCM10010967_32040 [Dyadobacter beijingensis]